MTFLITGASRGIGLELTRQALASGHRVQTEMGGKGATTTVTESAQGILNLIKNSKRSDTGKFFDYRGR